jgi:phage shock protein A
MIQVLIRIWNFFFGWLGLRIGDLEAANPEVVYANQIRNMKERYQRAKDAASQLKARHTRLMKEDAQQDAEVAELQQLLDVALENNDDKSATEILEKQELIAAQNAQVEAEIIQVKADVDAAIETLNEVEMEIRKLEKEKVEMVSKMKSAEARLEVEKAFDGLSPSAESESLNNVREAINAKVARASFGKDLKENSHEGRMAKLRQQAGKKAAADKLAEMKAARAAKKSA